jgi:protein ImuB
MIVSPGQTWEALAPLPVEALRLPAATCELLAGLGLRRIEQLAALARPTLLSRFGPVVLEKLDRARGDAAEAIAALPPPAELEFSWLLEHPTTRLEMIEWTLEQLIARVCGALQPARRGVLRLQCRFVPESGPAAEFVVGLYRPSAHSRHLMDLAKLKLEGVKFRQGVAAIHTSVLAADRLEVFQQTLFANPGETTCASRELSTLVDRLSNRLGAHAVVRPWLLADAQPEFTCHYQPWAALASKRRGPIKSKIARREPPREQLKADRPLLLEPRPLRLSVLSIAPEGPPVRFSLAGEPQQVVRAWGPERIETGWWRSRCVRRDYYQVETARGARYWLFRQLNTGEWFFHGEFA